MNEYENTFQQIKEIIKINGTKGLYDEIKNLDLPNIKTKKDFDNFISEYLKKYDLHTFMINNKLSKIKNKMPYFEYKNEIGYVKFYKFMDNSLNSKNESKEFIELTKNKIDEWINKKTKGIIIDLREHYGGSFIPVVYGLYQLLGNGTLFGISKTIINKQSKNWITLINNNIKLQEFVEPKQIDIKIAILINENTASAGEFIGLSFKRQNVKFFGNDSRGLLSFNNNYKLKQTTLILTNEYVTDINMNFYNDKINKLKVDIFSSRPKLRAKQWISNFTNTQ